MKYTTRHLFRLLGRAFFPFAVLSLLIIALLLANDAASGANRLGRYYLWALIFSGIALLALLLAISRRLLRLWGELKRGVPGARLTRRLFLMLTLLCIPPVVVVYGFSLNFLSATIDTWFNVRLEESLNDALEMGRLYIDERLQTAERTSKSLAAELLINRDADLQKLLDEKIDSIGATEITLFGENRTILATASSDLRFLNPIYPDSNILIKLKNDSQYAVAEPFEGQLKLRIILPVSKSELTETRLLQVLFPLPDKLQTLAIQIENANFDFQKFKFLRNYLKLTFAIILTFVLFLSVLFAILASFTVAKRLVAPIARLASATYAVSAGRYDTPLPVGADDEIGFLLKSFKQMMRELELASARISRSTQEMENQRQYLKAVLERLSSGVLGIDNDGILRTVNRAADNILGVSLTRFIGHHLSEIRHSHPQIAPLLDPTLKYIRGNLREWREETLIECDGERRILMLHGAILPENEYENAGFVLVFDDLTVLNRAQRDAAWAEVARRLAHEVKNPLTPIQLAAERLRRRFIGRLPPDETELLDRATHTIVSQVEALKTMVNAFGDYARPPQLKAAPLALQALVSEVLDLYENDQRLKITRHFVADEVMLRADAGRFRQLLHNLIKNALEAIGDISKPHIHVDIQRIMEAGQPWIELSIMDNGPGLPDGFGDRWFEPYTTSKSKGTGLGLAVVKKIAEEHGGTVRAETSTQGGAKFSVRLPFV